MATEQDDVVTYDYLKPNGFLMAIDALPNVSFTCQQFTLPGISLGTALQPTPFVDIARTGDKIRYDPLVVTFLVDENLKNYKEMVDWMRGIGFPNSHDEFTSLVASRKRLTPIDKDDDLALYSDASLTIFNANNNPSVVFELKQLVPIALSPLEFDARVTNIQYITATAQFAIQDFSLQRV